MHLGKIIAIILLEEANCVFWLTEAQKLQDVVKEMAFLFL